MINVGFCPDSISIAGAKVLITQIIEPFANRIEPSVFCLDSVGKLVESLKEFL